MGAKGHISLMQFLNRDRPIVQWCLVIMTVMSLVDEDGYSVLVDDLIGNKLLVSCDDS